MNINLGKNWVFELESIDNVTPALGFKIHLQCESNNQSIEYVKKSVWIENQVWDLWSKNINLLSGGYDSDVNLYDLDGDVLINLKKKFNSILFCVDIKVKSVLMPKGNISFEIEVAEDEFLSFKESVNEFSEIFM